MTSPGSRSDSPWTSRQAVASIPSESRYDAASRSRASSSAGSSGIAAVSVETTRSAICDALLQKAQPSVRSRSVCTSTRSPGPASAASAISDR
jgi:hypothetical protein